uniref:TNase-like domain-containing protein n=1 Tax=Panagrellus redivivus TaxID=6233 RepID=A0A7E4V6R4_PANRE
MAATKGGGEEVRIVDPVDKYSVLIVRGTIIGTGLLGLALFVRNSKLFAKFEHVSHIPKDIIAKEIELRGTVREVTPTGYLRVEHRPIIRLPRLLTGGSSKKPVGLLNLKLAGLDISQAGLSYVSKDLRLTNKPVFFTVVKPTAGNSDAVDADVVYKKTALGRTNLNIDLVRRGYARVFAPHDPIHLKALQHNGAYSRLITRLLTSEKVADRRGVGVWERDGWVESVSSLPSATGQIIRANPVTKLLILTYNVLRDLAAVGYILAKQGYYLGVALVQYAGAGYRRFAKAVDRLSELYSSTKSRRPKAIEKK